MKNYVIKQFNGKEWMSLKGYPIIKRFNGKEWIELSLKQIKKLFK